MPASGKTTVRTDASSPIFSTGTVIFLDIERMDFVPKAMRDYYKSWTETVLEDGRFRPGYYAHSHNANLVYKDVKQVLVGDGVEADPPFWIASTDGFATDKDPSEVGHAFAQVWQGMLDVIETHNGVRLPIDVNVAQLITLRELRRRRGGYLTRVMKLAGGRKLKSTASQVVLH
jgi:hypothetical protein